MDDLEHIGIVRITLHNVEVEPSGDPVLEASLRDELRDQRLGQLLWWLTAISEELDRRKMPMSRN